MADDTPIPGRNEPDEFETEPLSHSPDSRFGPSTAGVDPMPEQIGPYRILEEIGRGGVGVVYLAAKESAGVRTRVAVKVLKRGMDTDDLLRRFELERQLLAALDHPNIARLLDAGATDDGRPYFVMEHIKGRPLDRYCDEKRLSIRERLELFKKICEAVQFAHQNLVVHRDIKPGNILVTDNGDPKLVDFGIAKLLNPNLSPVEYEPTAAYVRLMTPEYASPEQVRGDTISTSSDIYSLGVVLFELLTGKRPYRLPSRVLDEVRRIICEEQPERPSTAVTRVDAIGTRSPSSAPPSGPSTAQHTPSRVAAATTIVTGPTKRDNERLARKLTGDLDNIVLKALRKEPGRRYPSAEQFAQDIQRHIDGFPVTARADTMSYRARKFVHRHRASVTAASLVAVALLLGLAGTTYYAREANKALVAETAQRETSDRLAGDLREVLSTLASEVDTAMQTRGSTEARQLLFGESKIRLEELETEYPSNAALQFDLSIVRERLGDALGGIRSGSSADRDAALEQYQASLRTREALLQNDPDDQRVITASASSLIKIGDMLRDKGSTEGALANYQRAENLMLSIPASERTHDSSRKLLAASLSAGQTLEVVGQTANAQTSYQAALLAADEALLSSPNDEASQRDRTVALLALGELARKSGDLTESRRRFDAAIAQRRALVAASPEGPRQKRDLGVALYSLATTQLDASDTQGAIRSLTEANDIADALLREDPHDARFRRDSLIYRGKLAEIAFTAGNADDAIRLQRQTVYATVQLAAESPESASQLRSVNLQRNRLAAMLLEQNRPSEAIDELQLSEAIARSLRDRDPENATYQRDVCYTLSLLARASLSEAESAPNDAARLKSLERARVYSENTLAAVADIESRGIARGDEGALRAAINQVLTRADQLDLR